MLVTEIDRTADWVTVDEKGNWEIWRQNQAITLRKKWKNNGMGVLKRPVFTHQHHVVNAVQLIVHYLFLKMFSWKLLNVNWNSSGEMPIFSHRVCFTCLKSTSSWIYIKSTLKACPLLNYVYCHSWNQFSFKLHSSYFFFVEHMEYSNVLAIDDRLRNLWKYVYVQFLPRRLT